MQHPDHYFAAMAACQGGQPPPNAGYRLPPVGRDLAFEADWEAMVRAQAEEDLDWERSEQERLEREREPAELSMDLDLARALAMDGPVYSQSEAAELSHAADNLERFGRPADRGLVRRAQAIVARWMDRNDPQRAF